MSAAIILPGLRRLRGGVVPLVLLILWEFMSRRDSVHAFVFVPLEAVWASLLELVRSGELFSNWTASVLRTSTGFAIGAAAGIALGAVMAVSRIADRIVNPAYQAVRQVPLLGWIPLISLWFGNGEPSKLFIVSLAAFYPMVLNTYEGLRNVEARYLAVGEVFRLSRWQALRHIALPAALPSIFAGLMQATAFTWLSSVGSEFFFNPGPGLGNLMLNGQQAFRMDTVLVAVIGIGLTGFAMNTIIVRFADYALRWRNVRV